MLVLAYPKQAQVSAYNKLLYDGVERLGVEVVPFDVDNCPLDADLLHVHWPESFMARRSKYEVRRKFKRWMRCLEELKDNGTKIVWTAHNLWQHEGRHREFEEQFWSMFVPMVDGCICLSQDSVSQLKELRTDLRCPHVVIPHGHYLDEHPATVSREESRRVIGVGQESLLVVSVGRVRSYKNVPGLIRAFADIEGDARLVVAGKVFDKKLKREIEQAAASDERVKVVFGSVSGDELQNYLVAADLAAMPFTRILNSGSAILSLSFATPVLVPSMGSMPELQKNVGHDWVRTFNGAFTSETLSSAMAWATDCPRGDSPSLEYMEWEPIARRTVDFYRHVCSD